MFRSHEALRDFYFFDLGKRTVIVIVFRARNIVWVIHLLLLSDVKKTSESSIPSYCSVLFTTVICGWEEFILISSSFVNPRLALLCKPLVLVSFGNCSNLSLLFAPGTLFGSFIYSVSSFYQYLNKFLRASRPPFGPSCSPPSFMKGKR